MSNKKNWFILAALLLVVNLNAQTTEWQVVWDRNADIDSVEYYLIYRAENRTPTLSDLIDVTIPQPPSGSQDTVVYIDSDLVKGKRYVYSAIAVDSLDRRSGFSNTDDGAIPEILFSTLRISTNNDTTINLNESKYVNDPDHNSNLLSWDQPTGGSQISITINNQTNTARIQTPSESTVQETFTFKVTDPDGFFDTRQIVVSLYDPGVPNQAPVFTSQPYTIGSLSPTAPKAMLKICVATAKKSSASTPIFPGTQ